MMMFDDEKVALFCSNFRSNFQKEEELFEFLNEPLNTKGSIKPKQNESPNGTSLKRIELDLKTPTVRSQEHTPRFKKKLNHHAAQETDGARGRRLARREGGSIAGHENGRVAKPKSGTGTRSRILLQFCPFVCDLK